MTIAEIFEENLYSFVEMLSNLPCGAMISFGANEAAPFRGVVSASGSTEAGENYALFTSEAAEADIKNTLKFFSDKKTPFIIPYMPQTPFTVSTLAAYRLIQRKNYTAMYLSQDKFVQCSQKALCTDKRKCAEITRGQSTQWGEAVNKTFGGCDTDADVRYARYASALVTAKHNRAFALAVDGEIISTALLHETTNSTGLYYFATLPSLRRQGAARTLLAQILCPDSYFINPAAPLVLLATEEGVPFYSDFGFERVFDVPIYSQTDQI